MRVLLLLALVCLAFAGAPASAVGTEIDQEVVAGDGPYLVLTETSVADSSAFAAVDWVLCPDACSLDVGPGAWYTCVGLSTWEESNGVPGLQRAPVGTTPADTRTNDPTACTPTT